VGRERCDECGFDSDAYDDAALLAELSTLGPRWRALLELSGEDVRTRPAPEVWSAIEYAAHSRDITAIHAVGVETALTGDEPVFPAIADDAVDAMATGYATEAVDAVLVALNSAVVRLVGFAEGAPRGVWKRGVTVGADRSDVREMLAHVLHDSTHHLRDVELGLARLRAKTP
jgi:hypothetical protein